MGLEIGGIVVLGFLVLFLIRKGSYWCDGERWLLEQNRGEDDGVDAAAIQMPADVPQVQAHVERDELLRATRAARLSSRLHQDQARPCRRMVADTTFGVEYSNADIPLAPIAMPPAATLRATSTDITTTTGRTLPRAVSSFDSGAAPPSYEDLMGNTKGVARMSSFV